MLYWKLAKRRFIYAFFANVPVVVQVFICILDCNRWTQKQSWGGRYKNYFAFHIRLSSRWHTASYLLTWYIYLRPCFVVVQDLFTGHYVCNWSRSKSKNDPSQQSNWHPEPKEDVCMHCPEVTPQEHWQRKQKPPFGGYLVNQITTSLKLEANLEAWKIVLIKINFWHKYVKHWRAEVVDYHKERNPRRKLATNKSITDTICWQSSLSNIEWCRADQPYHHLPSPLNFDWELKEKDDHYAHVMCMLLCAPDSSSAN